ncbi:MAG: hypothetical protein AAFR33_10160 [Pseudomonadota bacterium]
MGWAKDFALWMRDEAGAFLASFWMICTLYGIGAYLLWVWFRVDAEFSRPLAGGVIPSDVTQHYSWAILAFSVIVGMAATWCHYRDMKREKRIFSVLAALAVIVLLSHAWGLSAKIIERQYANSAVIMEVADTQTNSNAAQIAAIEGQIASVERRTAQRVATLQQSIDNITQDRLDNDELADPYRASQQEAQDNADTQIAALQERLLLLLADSGDTLADAQLQDAQQGGFNELFTFFARISTWNWNPGVEPNLNHQYGWGALFFFIFWGLGKLLMMSLFTLAFAMQQKAAAEARKARSAREGWKTRRANEEDAEKTKQRRARQSGKLIPGPLHIEQLQKAIHYARTKKHMAALGIIKACFGPKTDLDAARDMFNRWIKSGHMTEQEANLILNKKQGFAVAPNEDPRAAKPNGLDHTPPPEGGDDADQPSSGQSDHGV